MTAFSDWSIFDEAKEQAPWPQGWHLVHVVAGDIVVASTDLDAASCGCPNARAKLLKMADEIDTYEHLIPVHEDQVVVTVQELRATCGYSDTPQSPAYRFEHLSEEPIG